MTNFDQVTQHMGECEILKDSLMSQKMLTDSYNTFAGECVNEQLRSAMLGILNEEHQIQADIFCDMKSRGWYQTEPADQNKVMQTRQKFTARP